MSFTYGQLKQAIQDYTENDETSFINNIPVFIRSAEERILKSVQLSLFRKNATTTTDINNQYLAVPSDFLAPFSLSMTGPDGDKEFIEFKVRASYRCIRQMPQLPGDLNTILSSI